MKTKADLYDEYTSLAIRRDSIAKHIEELEIKMMEVKTNIEKYKDKT